VSCCKPIAEPRRRIRRRAGSFAPRQQRGVVLVVVLIIVALVALIATQINSQLLLNERRTTNILHTDQAWQYALGAEALASSYLNEALKDDPDRAHLGQPWAKSEFYFPVDGGAMRGHISDLSTCFNINALLAKKKKAGNPGAAPNEPVKAANEQTLTGNAQLLLRLFEQLVPNESVSPQALVSTLIDWLDDDSDPVNTDGAEDYDYQGLKIPYRTGNGPLGAISELRTVRGFSPEIYRKLRPYLCVLPDSQYLRINFNTLPPERAELLTMLFDNLPVETARSLLQSRPKNGFKDKDAFRNASGMPADAKPSALGETIYAQNTDYFLLSAEVVVGPGRARVESVLKKESDKRFRPVSRAFSEE